MLRFVQTDAEGRYEALAHPGSTSYCHVSEPKGYLKQFRGLETSIGKIEGQVLAPIELVRGETMRGFVVDGHGNRVADAAVEGKWERIVGPGPKGSSGVMMGAGYSASATSNAQGEFLLEGIHKGANVMLEASLEEARTERPQQATVGAGETVKLVISSLNTVSLHGQVMDPRGKPVAGALVRIRSRPLKSDGYPEPGPVRFHAGEIHTDRDGRFRTPRQLKRGFGYRAEIRPADRELSAGELTVAGSQSRHQAIFPQGDTAAGCGSWRGRVVDSRGTPIAGAQVVRGRGHARAETGDHGW